MGTTRRNFLKTLAALGPMAALPACRPPSPPDGAMAGAAPRPLRPAPAASVLVSGGTITKEGQFLDHVRAAHRSHYAGRRSILLILHATVPAERDAEEKKVQAMFAADGFAAESLHHHAGGAARDKIDSAEAFFVGGGETFLLLRTLYDGRQLEPLRERVLAGAPYHGTSAGCNVAGSLIGCTNDFPVVDIPTRVSLGIFPAVLNPHHPPAGDPEYAGRVNKIKGYLRVNPGETVLALGNGAVARRQGGEVSLVHGPGFLYSVAGDRVLTESPIPELSAFAAIGV